MEQPPVGSASRDEMAMMREWCKTYGASVRQRSVRQESKGWYTTELPVSEGCHSQRQDHSYDRRCHGRPCDDQCNHRSRCRRLQHPWAGWAWQWRALRRGTERVCEYPRAAMKKLLKTIFQKKAITLGTFTSVETSTFCWKWHLGSAAQ